MKFVKIVSKLVTVAALSVSIQNAAFAQSARRPVLIQNQSEISSRRDVVVSLIARELNTDFLASGIGLGQVGSPMVGISILPQKHTVEQVTSVLQRYPTLFTMANDGSWYYTENCSQSFSECGNLVLGTALIRLHIQFLGPVSTQPIRTL